MFRASWTTPHNGEVKTLRLLKDPRYHGLGQYYDEEGTLWDVHSIRGVFVTAREVIPGAYSGYYDTTPDGGGNGVIHKWIPYKVEVVGT